MEEGFAAGNTGQSFGEDTDRVSVAAIIPIVCLHQDSLDLQCVACGIPIEEDKVGLRAGRAEYFPKMILPMSGESCDDAVSATV